MDNHEALLLGQLQRLTEYLPVSSSGHLTLGSALFGIEAEENMMFTVAVHVATVLSTLVVLGGEILKIFKGMFHPLGPGRGLARLNEDQRYVLNILVSMIPIGIVGVFFKDQVEEIFGSGLLVVGCCLLATAALLTFSYYAKPRQRENISLGHAFIIGLVAALLAGSLRGGALYYLQFEAGTGDIYLNRLVTVEVWVATLGTVVVCGLGLTMLCAFFSVNRYLTCSTNEVYLK